MLSFSDDERLFMLTSVAELTLEEHPQFRHEHVCTCRSVVSQAVLTGTAVTNTVTNSVSAGVTGSSSDTINDWARDGHSD